MPCHPLHTVWSREHVIPTSIHPNKMVTQSHHNIIPMPKRLNNARGNRPYTGKKAEGFVIYACDSCPTPGMCRAAAVVTPSGVIPPDIFKGPIARSVLRSVGDFPAMYDVINKKVLDIDTAIEWDSNFPMSVQEHDWFVSKY